MAYSIIIKNGTIFDGTGASSFIADIGIKKDIISVIGNLSNENADFVFDASGFFVCPGFIDVTNHSDSYGTIFHPDFHESLVSQGISTILLGNCGESLVPLTKKETISINANWNSVGEYFNEIEKKGIGVNCATLVGQETLLKNADDLKSRLFLLERALEEGAFGMSSNFSFHNISNDFMEETTILLQAVKKANGVYKTHIRDEGKDFLPAVVSIINLVRQTGVRTVLSHLKVLGRSSWHYFDKAINIIRMARKEGVDVSFDIFPYFRTGSKLISLLPLWAQDGSKEKILERIYDKSASERIVYDLKNITLHPELILISSALKDKKIVGRSLFRISQDWEKSPEEAILEILKINDTEVNFFGRTINPINLFKGLAEDYSAVSSNGAGYDLSFGEYGNLPHPRSFGAFPRFISKLAAAAHLKTEEAIKKVTSIPASMLRLKNKGILKSGFAADINVFDHKSFKDNATYFHPFKYSSGLKLLLISGNKVFLNGQFLGKFGKVIRKYD